MTSFFEISISKNVILNSLKVSFIVGIVLNIINQYEYIFSANFVQIDYLKLTITFIIPFLVSNYSITKDRLSLKVGDKCPLETKLKCKNCNEYSVKINKNDTIPICKNCLEKTDWRSVNED